MTWSTLTNADPKNTHCLVCLPDSLFIVAIKQPDDIAPDTFCKVKGWEQCLCKVVALGSEGEVKAAMNEMHMAVVQILMYLPPRRKLELNRPKRTLMAKRTAHHALAKERVPQRRKASS